MTRRDSPLLRRLVRLLLFLVLVDEDRSVYNEHMFTFFGWVRPWLVDPAMKVRPVDVLFAGILAISIMRGAFQPASTSVRPMKRTLFGGLAVTLIALVYGLATGGDGRAAGWQVYLPMSTILVAFTVAATHRTAEDFLGLIHVIVGAAVWHAVMCVIFHMLFVHSGRITPAPDYEGTHDDTVIWTIAACFLLLRALQFPTSRNKLLAGFLVPLLVVAMQYNKRRLAWISLGASVLTLYFLLPPGAAKRRIQRAATIAVPILLLYVAVGWGRNESIFRPLQSLQTVSTEENNSTKARYMENLGLIATVDHNTWLFGSGWGHKYVEVSSKYQIYFFELWPYVPHNSVLGLFAYTGYLGFVGYWMSIPMAAFFHARTARKAPRLADRSVGMIALVQLVACADQWYGDMGSFSIVTMYTLAASFGAALRLPISSGVWPDATRPAAAAPQVARGV